MTLDLAKRLDVVQPSATVAIAEKATLLRSQGVDVLSFSVGEPDFDTPKHICEAAKKAIDAGATRYTATGGILPLREAIAARSAARRGGARHEASEVLVSVGAKHTLFNLALALYEPGDEVVIPAPYWVSYPEQVRVAGAEPVIVETTAESGYRVTPAALEAAISPRTKAVVLCSPSNPTGSAYTAEQLRALADVLAKHSCWIIVDEIYGELVYGGFEQKSILEVAPELRDRIVIVDGVSKTYAMTGWRIGWMLAPKALVKACNTIQGQATTNPTTAAQHATIAALTGSQDCVAEMRAAFEKRRALVVEGISGTPGLSCTVPEGAFYVFVDASALLGKKTPGGVALEDDLALCAYLLDEARCALVPGSAFGAPGCFRMSYACSEAQIEAGIARLREAIAKLV
ncbi:MAG: pyridoxal phosphate-dependent aminotransferase [Myxococcales bacterium]|nr:pyridoxal phosphate-dependent aminotransferase [Myxococcales bacterium]